MTGFNSKRQMAADKVQEAREVDYWIREATAARQAEMALRRELEAQPAQEPVAHVYLFDHEGRPLIAWDNAKGIKIGDKLYTAPLQRQMCTTSALRKKWK
jgi:hypothetical protein